MNVDFCIIPECYTDTNLIETIVPPLNKKGYNHQMGCNKVSSKMQFEFKNSFVLGIIDKDKRQIGYLNEFDEISSKNHLHLFKHKLKHHYIIQISPAIEVFILETATENRIHLNDLGLPENLDDLKKITKRKTSKKDIALSNLFKKLMDQKADEIVSLSEWILYLRKNTYNSDVEELKKI